MKKGSKLYQGTLSSKEANPQGPETREQAASRPRATVGFLAPGRSTSPREWRKEEGPVWEEARLAMGVAALQGPWVPLSSL